jgi:hypothetical protein
MKLPKLSLGARKRLYLVAVAAATLLGIYGVLNATEAAGWVALAGAALGYSPALSLGNLADKSADE